MAIQIKLDNSNPGPGGILSGVVLWQFETQPRELTLDVSWETSGKGTGDSDIVHTEEWLPDNKKGEKRFQFTLPRGPISVQGNLISIRWIVECTSEKPDEECSVSFVLSHMPSYVRLMPVGK